MPDPENMTLVLLREMRGRMEDRFDRVDQKLTGHDARFDALEKRSMTSRRQPSVNHWSAVTWRLKSRSVLRQSRHASRRSKAVRNSHVCSPGEGERTSPGTIRD